MIPEHDARIAGRQGLVTSVLSITFVLGMLLAVAACHSPAGVSRLPGQSVSASSTAYPPPTPTLQSLAPDEGWHEVALLGNAQGNTSSVGTSFETTDEYAIYVACEGHGTLTIAYTPGGTSTLRCTDNPLINGIPPQHSTRGETVHVGVTADARVTWRALVEVHG